MADVPSITTVPMKAVSIITWTGINTDNVTGEWVTMPRFADKCVHIFGVFDGGDEVVQIVGSNEPGVPGDPQGLTAADGSAAINETGASDMFQILENPLQIRPQLNAGGTEDTAITVVMVCETAR